MTCQESKIFMKLAPGAARPTERLQSFGRGLAMYRVGYIAAVNPMWFSANQDHCINPPCLTNSPARSRTFRG